MNPNSRHIVNFTLAKIDIPMGLTGDLNSDDDGDKKDKKEKSKGKVVITYSNYKVNQGLNDAFFEKKNKK